MVIKYEFLDWHWVCIEPVDEILALNPSDLEVIEQFARCQEEREGGIKLRGMFFTLETLVCMQCMYVPMIFYSVIEKRVYNETIDHREFAQITRYSPMRRFPMFMREPSPQVYGPIFLSLINEIPSRNEFDDFIFQEVKKIGNKNNITI